MKFANVEIQAQSSLLAERVQILKPFLRTNRILIVVESASWFTDSFGLSKAIRVVDGADFGFAVTRVTLAVRDATEPTKHVVSAADRLTLPTYTGFRLTMLEPDGSNTIDHFDQIWFFGINPGNNNLQDDTAIARPEMVPLVADEVSTLKTWMDAGGGVFATGDHDVLGASMGSFIPRVRRMRKWTAADGSPTIGGTTRIDTNRPHLPAEVPSATNPNPEVIEFDRQSDTTLQRIDWVTMASSNTWPWIYHAPHAVLCHPTLGPIDVMPDHPHEGLVFDDAEFSDPHCDFPAGAKPKVIAYGNTLADPPYNLAKGDQPARRFPMISVYDGQRYRQGRVVVDSTWHHWLDVNIAEIAAANSDDWRKVSRYYVNIATWLAKRSWRLWMLESTLVAMPYTTFGQQELSLKLSDRALGGLVVKWLGRHLGPCWVRELLFDFARPEIIEVVEEIRKPGPSGCLTCPPFDALVEAAYGAIARERLSERTELEGVSAEQADRHVTDAFSRGAAAGLHSLSEQYAESAARSQRLVHALGAAARKHSGK